MKYSIWRHVLQVKDELYPCSHCQYKKICESKQLACEGFLWYSGGSQGQTKLKPGEWVYPYGLPSIENYKKIGFSA